MDTKEIDISYAIQNIAVFGIVLGIFPFVPGNLTTISFVIGVCMVAYRWLKYHQKPDCWGKIQWAPILSMLFFVAMLILASQFSLDVHKSSNVAYNYFKYMKPAMMLLVLMHSGKWFYKSICYALLAGTFVACVMPEGYAYKYFYLHQTGYSKFYEMHRCEWSDYLIMFLPIIFWYWWEQSLTVIEKFAWGFILILALINLVAMQCRGAICSLILGCFLLALIYCHLGIIKKAHLYKFLLTCGCIIALSLFVLPQTNHLFALKETIDVQEISKGDYKDKGRLYVYRGALNMIKDYPVFGVGLDNFNQVYRSKYMVPGAVEKNLPHAHNIFLAFMTTTGMVGTLGFLAMEGTIFYTLCKNCKGSIGAAAVLVSMTIFILHHCVDFVFQVPLIVRFYFIILVLGLAFIAFKNNDKAEK